MSVLIRHLFLDHVGTVQYQKKAVNHIHDEEFYFKFNFKIVSEYYVLIILSSVTTQLTWLCEFSTDTYQGYIHMN